METSGWDEQLRTAIISVEVAKGRSSVALGRWQWAERALNFWQLEMAGGTEGRWHIVTG